MRLHYTSESPPFLLTLHFGLKAANAVAANQKHETVFRLFEGAREFRYCGISAGYCKGFLAHF